jgi:hypothetical protein
MGEFEEEEEHSPLLSPPTSVSIIDAVTRLDAKGKEYTAYRMKVVRCSAEADYLEHRFSAFHELDAALRQQVPMLLPSPMALCIVRDQELTRAGHLKFTGLAQNLGQL